MKTDTWQCAGWSCELHPGPLARQLSGRQVVLFRDANGTAHALNARCPHRGADLSQGSVVDGCIQCPFHGWQFDGGGRCVKVPSQPDGVKIPRLACTASFPLHERDGTLWIWIGADAAAADAPGAALPPPDRSGRRLFFPAHLVAAPFLDTLENFFDMAHVPYIHRSFGSHQDPLVTRRRLTLDPDGHGIRAEDDPASPWQVEPRLPGGVLGLLARLFLGLRKPIAQHTAFDVVAGAQVYLEYPNGTFDLFRTHLTPADDRHTWLFIQSLRTRAAHALGDWIQRRAIGTLLEEGKREQALILAADRAGGAAAQVSVESDRVGLAVRHLYERWAGGAATPSNRDLALGE